MGIKQLSKLLKERAPKGISYRKQSFYNSYAVAIDASLAIYQFLVAVRSDGSNLGYGEDTTSHLVGIFYRTTKMIENGIVPVYVFDGKAPAMKIHELKKRVEKREKAEKMLKAAEALEDLKSVEKYEKRRVKMDSTHIEDCIRLLEMMGVPTATAPSEAEAHCAFLGKSGSVKAVATEDMDALCFGAPVLLRNMNVSQSKGVHIEEYNLSVILKELDMTMDAFIDMCILLGCDYCNTIKGVGYKRAYELIKKHGSIEAILEKESLEVSENMDFQAAREIFKNLAIEGATLVPKIDYEAIDVDRIVEFLCGSKGFDEKRVRSTVDRILATRGRGIQKKMEFFFTKK